jgi:uncharacterized integral membrane protein
MAKLLRSLLAIVGLIVIVTFSVANRGIIDVNFFPLPLPIVELPVYAVFLIGIFLGAILGGLSLWLSESEMRAEWRTLRRKARAEAYRQKQQEIAEEQLAAERSRQRQDALALAAPRR